MCFAISSRTLRALFVGLLVLGLGSTVAMGAVTNVICVPWQGNPLTFHTAISGQAAQLMGVIKTDSTATIWYKWVFGDGTETAVATLGGSTTYNVSTTHTYTAATGTPFTAKLMVDAVDSSMANAVSDNFLIKIQNNNIDTRANIAIDRGLWWLFTAKAATTVSGLQVYYWSYNGYYAETAQAALAFQINNHKQTNDPNEDPYAPVVQGALRYLFYRLNYSAPVLSLGNDIDHNANGHTLYVNQGNYLYQGGQFMDAIIASGTPNAVADVGLTTYVLGKTYKEVIQDMVDYYAMAVYQSMSYGGWRYSYRDGPDNSASQWGAIGLLPAQDLWGCTVPDWLKVANNNWLTYSYNVGGQYFGYTNTSPVWSSGYNTRPSGMVQMVMSSPDYKNDSRWIGCMDWYNNIGNWNSFAITAGTYYYGWYAFVKAMKLSNTETFASGLNWYRGTDTAGTGGLAKRLCDAQQSGGNWPSSDSNYGYNYVLMTAWSINMLRPALFQAGPAAAFTAKPVPTYANYPITFDGSTSTHSDPARTIVLYEWDWNNDGTYDETGMIVQHSFPALGDYPVTLRVTDDNAVALTAATTLTIEIGTPPFPPVAHPGGPYIVSRAAADTLKLDGSASVNPDDGEHEAGNPLLPGDSIIAWDWDLVPPLTDFGDRSGEVVVIGSASINTYFTTLGSHDIGLRVTDNTAASFPNSGEPNLTDAEFTTVTLYSDLGVTVAASTGCASVELNWAQAGQYEVLRSMTSPNEGFVKIGDANGASYSDSTVVSMFPAITYWYRLRAGTALSTAVQITYLFDITKCVKITDLAARAKDGKVQLTWSPQQDADHYKVYRSTSAGVPLDPAHLLADNVVTSYCTYLDLAVVNGTPYFYKVVCIGSSGEELSVSNEASATPRSRVPAPSPASPAPSLEIVAASVDKPWVYQNASDTVGRHAALLTVSFQDTYPALQDYDITISEAVAPGRVVIEATADPTVFKVKGGAVGTVPGLVTLNVTVAGKDSGASDSRQVTLSLRTLGDINSSGGTTSSDNVELTKALNGLPSSYGVEELDLNGDGAITTADSVLMTKILNGMAN